MANVQPDEYTRISNVLLDALCKTHLSGTVRQILDTIFRKTYGWHKKTDRISLSQFSECTGLTRRNCLRSINKLEKMNMIIVDRHKNYSEYTIQKDFDLWKIPSSVVKTDNTLKDQVLSKRVPSVVKTDNRSVVKTDNNKRKEIYITKESK